MNLCKLVTERRRCILQEKFVKRYKGEDGVSIQVITRPEYIGSIEEKLELMAWNS